MHFTMPHSLSGNDKVISLMSPEFADAELIITRQDRVILSISAAGLEAETHHPHTPPIPAPDTAPASPTPSNTPPAPRPSSRPNSAAAFRPPSPHLIQGVPALVLPSGASFSATDFGFLSHRQLTATQPQQQQPPRPGSARPLSYPSAGSMSSLSTALAAHATTTTNTSTTNTSRDLDLGSRQEAIHTRSSPGDWPGLSTGQTARLPSGRPASAGGHMPSVIGKDRTSEPGDGGKPLSFNAAQPSATLEINCIPTTSAENRFLGGGSRGIATQGFSRGLTTQTGQKPSSSSMGRPGSASSVQGTRQDRADVHSRQDSSSSGSGGMNVGGKRQGVMMHAEEDSVLANLSGPRRLVHRAAAEANGGMSLAGLTIQAGSSLSEPTVTKPTVTVTSARRNALTTASERSGIRDQGAWPSIDKAEDDEADVGGERQPMYAQSLATKPADSSSRRTFMMLSTTTHGRY